MKNSPEQNRFDRKLFLIIVTLFTLIITFCVLTFFGGTVHSQVADSAREQARRQDPASSHAATEDALDNASAPNSGAHSLPALHVVLAWESLMSGENLERKNYQARLDTCRGAGWPTRALSSAEEAKLGTGVVEILIDAQRQFARQTQWTLGADGEGKSICFIRLEKHMDHDAIENVTGMYEAIDSDARIQDRQTVQATGWKLVGEEQINGQPCTRWKSDRQDVCMWSGGMKWGFAEAPSDVAGCTVDGAGTYLNAIPLEAKPLEGGSGCTLQVKSFSLGKGLLPSNAPSEETGDEENSG